MFCQNCGKEIPDGANICIHCGVSKASVEALVQTQVQTIPGNGLGIFSMIMGIVSVACCNGFGLISIIGLITGIISMNKAKMAGEKNSYAVAGVVCSAISLASFVFLAIVYLILFVVYGFSLASLTGMSYY